MENLNNKTNIKENENSSIKLLRLNDLKAKDEALLSYYNKDREENNNWDCFMPK